MQAHRGLSTRTAYEPLDGAVRADHSAVARGHARRPLRSHDDGRDERLARGLQLIRAPHLLAALHRSPSISTTVARQRAGATIMSRADSEEEGRTGCPDGSSALCWASWSSPWPRRS